MSELSFMEKLLDGAKVELLNLSQVTKIKHGKDWKGLNAGDIPVYGSGGIMGYVDEYAYDKPTVLIPRKGSITNIFYVESPFWNVDTIYYTEIDTAKMVPKYLYHFIKTIDLMALDTGSGRPSLTQAILNQLQIPIPSPDNPAKSLEIQSEIVRILDTFTAMTTELTTELSLRKKQYNHYRDQLLSFEEGEVEWKKLGEVATITIGEFVHKDKQDAAAKYPVYNGGRTPTGYYDKYNNTGKKVIVSARGANAGFVNRISTPYWAGNSCYSVGVRDIDTLHPDFAYYLLKQSELKLTGIQQKGGIPAVSKKQMEELLLPIPSIYKQERIVAILDKFDTLTTSISEGLPREIELRQKQYEYYRDLLLSFPKPDTSESEAVA